MRLKHCRPSLSSPSPLVRPAPAILRRPTFGRSPPRSSAAPWRVTRPRSSFFHCATDEREGFLLSSPRKVILHPADADTFRRPPRASESTAPQSCGPAARRVAYYSYSPTIHGSASRSYSPVSSFNSTPPHRISCHFSACVPAGGRIVRRNTGGIPGIRDDELLTGS